MSHVAKTMSPDYTKCSIFLKIAFLIIFINFCTSAPVNVTENAYTQFIAELNRNKCSVPTQVQLPFDTAKVDNFEYLSPYLQICQKTESTKRNREAVVLCKEIFDNVRNISCPTKTALPDINVKLSNNVCKDISAQKELVPEDDKSLLKRLTDSFLCDIMCDSEFEKACQVLLWSFEVQKLISSVANPEEPEQSNVPEDGVDNNGVTSPEELEHPNVPEDGVDNNDNIKQDNTVDEGNLPQGDVDAENGEQNVIEGKDKNEVAGHNDIAKISEPNKLKDNPEQKPGITATNNRNEKQETIVPTNEAVSETETVSKPVGQDLTGVSKSTSSLQTSSTLTQQTSVQSNSNSEAQLMEEIIKGNSNVQNGNKQLQGSIDNEPFVKHDEVDAGDVPSKGSNTNVATDEQNQAVNANMLDNKLVQDKKDNKIPSNTHLTDDSTNPGNPLNNGETPNNEILGEIPQKPNPNPDFNSDNELPHESGYENGPNDAAADLHNSEQNPSNLVKTLAQNKPQNTTGNDDKLAKKADSLTTATQTTKDTTQHNTIPESSLNKTSISREEAKANQTQANSDLRKVDIQDQNKAIAETHGLINDDGTKDELTDQKPKVAQPTEEFDSTIPVITGGAIPDNEKTSEKKPKSKTITDSKSVIPSSLTETSTKTTVALEKMEGGSDLRQPADKEADIYADLENTEEDYPRPDYEGGLYEGSKTKESDSDVPSPVAKDIITSQNEKPMEFPSRNSFGQDSNDIQMIGFPEQEDSHFFFYFLSIVLILMAGYLIFHNKQKIIALIVEGRHERNRRSHRIGYKKLETK